MREERGEDTRDWSNIGHFFATEGVDDRTLANIRVPNKTTRNLSLVAMELLKLTNEWQRTQEKREREGPDEEAE